MRNPHVKIFSRTRIQDALNKPKTNSWHRSRNTDIYSLVQMQDLSPIFQDTFVRHSNILLGSHCICTVCTRITGQHSTVSTVCTQFVHPSSLKGHWQNIYMHIYIFYFTILSPCLIEKQNIESLRGHSPLRAGGSNSGPPEESPLLPPLRLLKPFKLKIKQKS